MFQAFEFGPFLVWSRLLMVLLGVWFSTEFFLRIAESASLSLQNIRDKSLYYVTGFVIGGRLTAMIAEYNVFLREPLRIVMLTDGVFSFLGGGIGVGVVLYLTTRGGRTTFLQWLDALLPAVCLGLVFSWAGAFLSGDAYGRPTDVFWGITYDTPYVRYAIPVHPVQVYYALFYIVLTFLLLVVRKRAKRVGSETLVGIVIACLGTFMLEFFRGDFAIPVFATMADFSVLLFLFASLGVVAVLETRVRGPWSLVYEVVLLLGTVGYMALRAQMELETYELRLSQLIAVLALLGTVVYVVAERRRHPHF